MTSNTSAPADQVDALKQMLILEREENSFLREQIRLLKAKLFGRKTEVAGSLGEEQLAIFDNEETDQEKPGSEGDDEVTVHPHKRKKVRKRMLPESLPRRHVYHEVADKDMDCACGCRKSVIGDESSETLEFHPARLEVVVHHRQKVACQSCEGIETEGGTVTTAPAPEKLIPKSYATPSLLAHILSNKFVDGLPFYRQESLFTRMGFKLDRSTMCAWAMIIALKAAKVYALLLKAARECGYLQIDETTVQVLNEKGRANTTKSYMWVIRGGPPDQPIVLFQYQPSRASQCAAELLEGFRGYVQADGYSGYEFLEKSPDIILLACMAHVRRKFTDVCKSLHGKKTGKKGLAGKAIGFIKALYVIEAKARQDGLTHEQIRVVRQTESKPLLVKFKTWLDETKPKVPPKSLLGQAITYALGQWPRLERYVEQGYLQIDNNLIENAIRPFVIGRKAWLFSGSPDGAEASATLYSLVVTAKANGWDPHAYLLHLLEGLVHADTDQEFAALLPNQAPPTAI